MGNNPVEVKVIRAMEWVNAELEARPEKSKIALIDEASRRFDLSPKEGESLLQSFLAERKNS